MGNSIPKATHEGSIDVGFGPTACANLDDGVRIIAQSDLLQVFGRDAKPPTRRNQEFDKLPPFWAAKNLQPFIGEDLRNSTNPIIYKPLSGGRAGKGVGYRAEVLPAVCMVYYRAKQAGALRDNQKHIAERCEKILFALVN